MAKPIEYLQHRLYHWYPHSDHRTRILELYITDDFGRVRQSNLSPKTLNRQYDLWLMEMWAEWAYFDYDLLYRD